MTLIQTIKAALLVYTIERVALLHKSLDEKEREIDRLGIDSDAAKLVRIEQLSKEASREAKYLSTIRSVLGHDD